MNPVTENVLDPLLLEVVDILLFRLQPIKEYKLERIVPEASSR